MSLMSKPQLRVRAKISSVGAYVPPRLLTNADLEKMVTTNDQWIVDRTGIRERPTGRFGRLVTHLWDRLGYLLRRRKQRALPSSGPWPGCALVVLPTDASPALLVTALVSPTAGRHLVS